MSEEESLEQNTITQPIEGKNIEVTVVEDVGAETGDGAGENKDADSGEEKKADS